MYLYVKFQLLGHLANASSWNTLLNTFSSQAWVLISDSIHGKSFLAKCPIGLGWVKGISHNLGTGWALVMHKSATTSGPFLESLRGECMPFEIMNSY